MFFQKNRVILFLVLPILLAVLALTIFVLGQQQQTRSKANKSTTLSLSPSSIHTGVNTTFTLDVMLDPGEDIVSYVKLAISYNPNFLLPMSPVAFTPNTQAFPTTLEGPVIVDNTLRASLSIGADKTKVITRPVRVGTLTFRAIAKTTTPSLITFGTGNEVLSTSPDDAARENVLANTVPAHVSVENIIDHVFIQPPLLKPPDVSAIAGGDTIHLSALAYDSSNVPIFSGVTYQWGLSSQQSVGTLTTTTGTITDFVPLNAGTGDLYVIATQNGTSITKGISVRVLTPSPTPQPTTPDGTTLLLYLKLHGIWPSGDNTKPQNLSSNRNPLNPTRHVNIAILDQNGQHVSGSPFTTTVTYDSRIGIFLGELNLGPQVQNGIYLVRMKTDRYLRKLVPGVQQFTKGTVINIPLITLIAGDIYNDNTLTILDYNILRDCGYTSIDLLPMDNPASSFHNPACQAHSERSSADLDDNGIINSFDYNLFLRNLLVQNGD